jgi:Xaa-Pro aminopeptidase
MNSYRDAAGCIDKTPETIYLETEVVPIALYTRFQKYFPFKNYKPLDKVVATVRAIKSQYELSLMRKAGKIHEHVLEDVVPGILKEGMSEADLAGDLFKVMINEGDWIW